MLGYAIFVHVYFLTDCKFCEFPFIRRVKTYYYVLLRYSCVYKLVSYFDLRAVILYPYFAVLNI